MMTWEERFRAASQRSNDFVTVEFGEEPDFGATPGDVLSYRQLWDPYVMGTLRALSDCADALDIVAKSPPQGFTGDELTQLATAYRNTVTKTLAQWNQFAGATPADILAQAGTMLQAYQSVVTDIGKMREDPNFSRFCPGNFPDPPTVSAQKAVIAQLEGAGLTAQGILQLFTQSVTKGLQVAAQTAGQTAGAAVKGVAAGLGIPWYVWAAVGVGAVVLVPKLLGPRLLFR